MVKSGVFRIGDEAMIYGLIFLGVLRFLRRISDGVGHRTLLMNFKVISGIIKANGTTKSM